MTLLPLDYALNEQERLDLEFAMSLMAKFKVMWPDYELRHIPQAIDRFVSAQARRRELEMAELWYNAVEKQ